MTIKLNTDNTWDCSVCDVMINKSDCSILNGLPKILNDENFGTFAEDISLLQICKGNDDFNRHYSKMI